MLSEVKSRIVVSMTVEAATSVPVAPESQIKRGLCVHRGAKSSTDNSPCCFQSWPDRSNREITRSAWPGFGTRSRKSPMRQTARGTNPSGPSDSRQNRRSRMSPFD